MINERTLVLVGSGFSVNLGGVTTNQIGEALDILADNDKPLKERIKLANQKLGNKLNNKALSHLKDIFCLLLDSDKSITMREAEERKVQVLKKIVRNYKRHFPKGNGFTIHHSLNFMSVKFDWLAFKSFYLEWKENVGGEKKNIVDFLTLLSQAYVNDISPLTKELFKLPKKVNTTPLHYVRRNRILNALLFYKYFCYKIFKLLLHSYTPSHESKRYLSFFLSLFNLVSKLPYQPKAQALQNKDFVILPISFLTFNWDPFLPNTLLLSANKLNKELQKKYNEENRVLTQVYVDFTIPLRVIRLSDKPNQNFCHYMIATDGAYTINELTAKSFFEKSKLTNNIAIRSARFFPAHGLFNMRFCPHCKQPFKVMPKKITQMSLENLNGIREIFLPDPIPMENDFKVISTKFRNTKIFESYLSGNPDELQCPYCDHPTYFEDTPLSVQTIFKFDEPDFLFTLKVSGFSEFLKSDHVIILGYSFPTDDMTNNYLLELLKATPANEKGTKKKRKKGWEEEKKEMKFTIIDYSSHPLLTQKVWYGIEEIENILKKHPKLKERYPISLNLNAVKKLSPNYRNNVRISFYGFPNILKKVSPKSILKFMSPN